MTPTGPDGRLPRVTERVLAYDTGGRCTRSTDKTDANERRRKIARARGKRNTRGRAGDEMVKNKNPVSGGRTIYQPGQLR